MVKLFLEPIHKDVTVPTKATTYSAGYDVYADIANRKIKVFKPNNTMYEVNVVNGTYELPANHRALIPTGFKMQCPEDFCIKFYPRSGNGLKHGIRLANGTGIIDADFPDETMVILHNTSTIAFKVNHNDRIAQLMVEETYNTHLEVVASLPEMESNRTGGFGHSGK